jgi:hypothetical protein
MMKFYRLDEIPDRPGEVIFRESRLNGAIFFCLFALLTTGILAFGVLGTLHGRAASFPRIIVYAIAAGLFLCTWVSLRSFRSSLRPGNWLIRCTTDGLMIKVRSYLNDHFPREDIVAFFLSNSDIAWVRKTREALLVPDKGNGESTERWTYLDIKLLTSETSDLEEHLKRERAREAPKVGISRTKFHHYPVRLLPEGIVRLDWRGPSSSIVPRIDDALKVLRFSLPVEREVFIDPRRGQVTDEKEMETRILELAERGKIIDATALARRRYGYDTRKAKEFVEELLKN